MDELLLLYEVWMSYHRRQARMRCSASFVHRQCSYTALLSGSAADPVLTAPVPIRCEGNRRVWARYKITVAFVNATLLSSRLRVPAAPVLSTATSRSCQQPAAFEMISTAEQRVDNSQLDKSQQTQFISAPLSRRYHKRRQTCLFSPPHHCFGKTTIMLRPFRGSRWSGRTPTPTASHERDRTSALANCVTAAHPQYHA